jgi:hypothetical protein
MRTAHLRYLPGQQLLIEIGDGSDTAQTALQTALTAAEANGGGERRGPYTAGHRARARWYGSIQGTSWEGVSAAESALRAASYEPVSHEPLAVATRARYR